MKPAEEFRGDLERDQKFLRLDSPDKKKVQMCAGERGISKRKCLLQLLRGVAGISRSQVLTYDALRSNV